MEIEEVAEHSPEKILKEFCDPLLGLQDFQCRALAFGLKLEGTQIAEFGKLAKNLYKLFVENDLAMAEINPLIVTATGNLVALDCKIGVDDNAVFRHKKLAAMNDNSQIDPKEVAAKECEISYIALSGIMRCDIIATGIIAAVKEVGVKVPVIVRLEGTNVELGQKMLAESGVGVISASDMTDAAK